MLGDWDIILRLTAHGNYHLSFQENASSDPAIAK